MKKKFLLMLVLCLTIGLCACGSNGNSANAGSNGQDGQVEQNDDIKQEPKEVMIELTIDNWQEYYDFRHEVIIVDDEFGDPVSFAYDLVMYIKEEYKDRVVGGNILFEFSETEYISDYRYEYNIETKELNYTEVEKWKNNKTYLDKIEREGVDEIIEFAPYGGCLDAEIKDGIATWEAPFISEIQISRLKGTLIILEE